MIDLINYHVINSKVKIQFLLLWGVRGELRYSKVKSSSLHYRVSLFETLPYLDMSLRYRWHSLRLILNSFDHHVVAVDCHRNEF